MEVSRNMRVLLTGHAGYIGPIAARVLTEAGHDVVGLDTGFFGSDGCASDLPTIRGDVRDISPSVLEGFDAVVHLAALSNDPIGQLDPDWTRDINVGGTLRIAELAKAAGVERFVFSSSCSVYGAAGGGDDVTEEHPVGPLTAYAESKARSEEGLSKLADSGFTPIYLRNATAYGVSPKLRCDLVLNNLVGWAHTTGEVAVMGDGTPWRPLVHIEDISRAAAAVLEAPKAIVHDRAFNVGVPGENYTVREIAETVRDVVPGSTLTFAGQGGGADNRSYRVSFDLLPTVVPNFQPRWNVAAGAVELRDAYRAANLQHEDFNGRRYVRLAQLKHLLDAGELDDTLRWRNAA
jgi:nucleoside-diphosphate-sugar epimerase